MVELFANSGDPDQTMHSAKSDLGLHCLPVTRLGVSSLQGLRANSADSKLMTFSYFSQKIGFDSSCGDNLHDLAT